MKSTGTTFVEFKSPGEGDESKKVWKSKSDPFADPSLPMDK